MAPFGGFDHNAQAIRIVTRLERHYAAFDGLNLTWETLEGIAKHNGPVAPPVPYALAEYDAVHDLELSTHSGPEAQVAALSDDIAYNNHDLHDGIRAGLFAEADCEGLPLLREAYAEVDALHPGLAAKRRRHEALRRVFGMMVEDVLAESRRRLDRHAPGTAADVRALPEPVIAFSEGMIGALGEIRRFLFERMYRAPPIMAERAQVTQVIDDLFPLYLGEPSLLPEAWRDRTEGADRQALARLVADYVAGMTDRFALREWRRLCGGGEG